MMAIGLNILKMAFGLRERALARCALRLSMVLCGVILALAAGLTKT
jgi:hypothetical protein